jgi:hypothetical protein
MRLLGKTCLALGALTTVAVTASAANAQNWRYSDEYGPAIASGPYDGAYDAVVPAPYAGTYAYGSRGWNGRYYSYGANRANPSTSPNGWDQDNPRDQQLQGHN